MASALATSSCRNEPREREFVERRVRVAVRRYLVAVVRERGDEVRILADEFSDDEERRRRVVTVENRPDGRDRLPNPVLRVRHSLSQERRGVPVFEVERERVRHVAHRLAPGACASSA